MKKALVLLLILGCVLTLLVQAASSKDFEIYIRNKLYTGEVVPKDKDLYIPLESFAKLARLTLHEKGGVYCLTDPAKGDEKCSLDGETTGLYVNGQKFEGLLPGKGGKALVPLKKISETLGAVFVQNASTGIIDVTFPKKGVTLTDIKAAESTKAVSKDLTLVYYYFDG